MCGSKDLRGRTPEDLAWPGVISVKTDRLYKNRKYAIVVVDA